MAESLESVLCEALRATVAARKLFPQSGVEIPFREAVQREIVNAELSIGRALALIGAGR